MKAGPTARVADHIADLMDLLGSEVILIACRRGTKRPLSRWKSVGPECMADPKYLAKLNGVNVGVVLGRRSGGLCTLDIDSDGGLKEFTERNREISDTLITRGARGGNFWWRLTGGYPPLTPLKRNGQPWGEWRADGAQTVIYGVHPSGCQYGFMRRQPPRQISFSDIGWLGGTEPSLLCNVADATERTERTERPEPAEVPEQTDANPSGVAGAQVFPAELSFEAALALSTPTEMHQNHDHLFTLARWVKGKEAGGGDNWPISELRRVFEAWLERSRPFLRPELSVDDYWFEFLEAYERARHGLGVNPVVAAWERVQRSSMPAVAGLFEDAGLRSLVALCRELARINHGGPFFLAGRTVQRLLQHPDHTRAARWLAGLARSRILKVVEAGGPETRRATRYRYLPQVEA